MHRLTYNCSLQGERLHPLTSQLSKTGLAPGPAVDRRPQVQGSMHSLNDTVLRTQAQISAQVHMLEEGQGPGAGLKASRIGSLSAHVCMGEARPRQKPAPTEGLVLAPDDAHLYVSTPAQCQLWLPSVCPLAEPTRYTLGEQLWYTLGGSQ